jgi:hypothetical protein
MPRMRGGHNIDILQEFHVPHDDMSIPFPLGIFLNDNHHKEAGILLVLP